MKETRMIEKRVRRENIQDAILRAVLAAGIVGVAALAPNALMAFQLPVRLVKEYRDRYSAYRAFIRLKERGDIAVRDVHGRKQVQITEQGKRRLGLMLTQQSSGKKKPTWDGNWRVVIYDIKEQRRKDRRALRSLLVRSGFFPLQDSVWVYPYPCEEMITLLKTHMRMGTQVLYMVVKHLENDGVVLRHFGIRR